MAKKKTTAPASGDASGETQQPTQDLRYHGDGSAMVDAKTLAKIHGEETLKRNADEARRIRAENGD